MINVLGDSTVLLRFVAAAFACVARHASTRLITFMLVHMRTRASSSSSQRLLKYFSEYFHA
jgi:hypothetical protein